MRFLWPVGVGEPMDCAFMPKETSRTKKASGVRAAVPGSQRPATAIARSWATAWPMPSGSSRVVLPGTHRPTRLPGCGVCERVSCSIVCFFFWAELDRFVIGNFWDEGGLTARVPRNILVQTPKPIQEWRKKASRPTTGLLVFHVSRRNHLLVNH
jgi:hypothetical protein